MIDTILVLLVVSLLAVGVMQRAGLSPIVGFLLVGAMVGPHALGLVPDAPAIRQMADFGIVFLMFTIGLEFSLSRLLAERFLVLLLGGLQVLVTSAVFAWLAWTRGAGLPGAAVIGAALAMSSTAIASRLLLEQGELETAYGRSAICVLLFQDLATIVFLLVMPVLAGGSLSTQAAGLGLALAKGAAVFFVLLYAGRLLIRPLFGFIARQHSPELFMLAVLSVSVGAAAFAHMMGLSLALGGFMAGTVVGETEFRHQVEADIRPFEDVLLGLFFITVGMLVDVHSFARLWPAVLAVAAALVLVKAGLLAALLRLTGAAATTAMRTAIALAHSGEFSLVILFLAMREDMLQAQTAQVVLAAVLLSMLVAPLLIRYSAALTEGLAGVGLPYSQRSQTAAIETASRDLSSHVILCGYGRVGQNVAWYLSRENVEYVALDLDLNRLYRPAHGSEHVTYGDATRRHMLIAAGLERAQAVVITFTNIRSVLKTLSHIHAIRPDVTTLVRTPDEQYLDELIDAGATEVIPDTLETSLTMSAHVLTLLGVPVARVAERNDRIRADRYRLLRGVFRGRRHRDHRDQLRIVTLAADAFAVGRSLGELTSAVSGITVTAVRRRGIRGADPAPQLVLQADDALIVHGSPEALARLERYLQDGERPD